MTDEYLEGIMNHSDIGEVYYTYSPQEQAARDELIKSIEREKRAYLQRIEPYLRKLENIKGTPNIVIRTALR